MMVFTKRLSNVQLEAIQYFASRLLSPQMIRNIGIRVVFRRKLPVLGITIIDDYNESGLPRMFTIEVNSNQDSNEKIRTIAHEMVHIKQYCKQELNEQMSIWKGQKVDADNIDYDDQPWEIEAHNLGDQIYEEFQSKEL